VAIGYAFGANLPNAIAVARSLNGWVCGLITCLLVVAGVGLWAARRWVERRVEADVATGPENDAGVKAEDRIDHTAAP
jgi:hypothetical protein